MKAIIGKRVDNGTAELREIRELATTAGYTVVDQVTQSRREDAAYGFGEGKVSEISERIEANDADALIVDNRLDPYQTYNIGSRIPDGVTVIDRFTLILEIFGQHAHTRTAQKQVELAELRYELPRASAKASLAKRDEHPGFMGLGEYDESRERDIKARISRIEDELAGIVADEEHWRSRRREAGFDLVALAGYTNAGKSTLLRRLADALTVDENADLHDDLESTAESQDQLFTTLDTTTRRADVGGRNVLVTDTVGFIRDLPHWLVESFRSTLEGAYRSDLLLLVIDASESIPEMREKIVTCHDTLYQRNEAPIVTVFNKIDRISNSELDRRERELSDVAPSPVSISATTGAGMDDLKRRIADELPELETERLVLPLSNDSMSLISWLHESAVVDDVTYTDSEAVVAFQAHDATVARARDRAQKLSIPSS